MLTTAARWESRRIRWQAPGGGGLLALLLLPLLFLTPWERIGWFSTSLEGIILLGWGYAFMVASNLGADTGEPSNGAFWLFQKGISIADYALASWIAASVWGAGFIVFGALIGSIALALYSELHVVDVGVLLGSGLLLFALLQVLYFLLGAIRLKRKTEVLLVLALLSVTQDIVFRWLPAVLQRVIQLGLPPLQVVKAVPAAVVNAQWLLAIADCLHLVIYLCACMAMAFALHRRWRPA